MDILCFSHLRWDFVFQRPQHLLSRFARTGRVFYVEEPHYDAHFDQYDVIRSKEGVNVIIPYLSGNADQPDVIERQRKLVTRCLEEQKITNYVSWYYTPMALQISDHLNPKLIVYDCMDELSAFKFAPPLLKTLEKELLAKADVVFTGGHSLYQAKKDQHGNIHPFPSSIDKAHFAQARQDTVSPPDQNDIPQPRFGYYGVIDERFDIDLIGEVAKQRPDWQFVFLGPVVKIDHDELPHRPNIHYLGQKNYDELPRYLAGWDVALIPFMLNEHTRYISPTKTPEYLAGGKPVISSSIQDVVHPYGVQNLVHIADTVEEFIACAERELATTDKSEWLARVDAFLEHVSWDATWQSMAELINQKLSTELLLTIRKETAYV